MFLLGNQHLLGGSLQVIANLLLVGFNLNNFFALNVQLFIHFVEGQLQILGLFSDLVNFLHFFLFNDILHYLLVIFTLIETLSHSASVIGLATIAFFGVFIFKVGYIIIELGDSVSLSQKIVFYFFDFLFLVYRLAFEGGIHKFYVVHLDFSFGFETLQFVKILAVGGRGLLSEFVDLIFDIEIEALQFLFIATLLR